MSLANFTFKIPEIKVISNFQALPFNDSKDIEEGLIKTNLFNSKMV